LNKRDKLAGWRNTPEMVNEVLFLNLQTHDFQTQHALDVIFKSLLTTANGADLQALDHCADDLPTQ
jgi:hypothetical protein